MKTKLRVIPNILQSELLIKSAVYLSLGAILGGGRLTASAYPFGVSLASAVGGVTAAAASAAGAILGSLRVSSVPAVNAAVAAGVFLLRLFLGGWLAGDGQAAESPPSADMLTRLRHRIAETARRGFAESVFIRMAVGAAGSMLCGAVRCAAGGYRLADLIGAVVSSVVSPLLVFLYASATDDGVSRGRHVLAEAGKCAVAGSLVMSLGGIIPYFDASVAAAFVITVLVTRDRGVLYGSVYGIVCGAALSPQLAPMLPIAALIFTGLKRLSPAIGVTAACTAGCIWSLYAVGMESLSTVLPELIITSAILAPVVSSSILPPPRSETMGVVSADDTPSLLLRRDTSRRMRKLSDSMKELSDVLYRLSDRLTSPDTEELCELCESSFEEACASCGMQSACFGREATATSQLQAKMTLALKNEGRISASLVPPAMAKRCYSMGQIIDRMNAGYARLTAESKLYDRTSVVAADYEVMAEMLRESSEYDSGEYELDRALTARLRSRIRGGLRAESLGVYGKRVKKVIARGLAIADGVPGGTELRLMLSEASGLQLSEPEFELDGPHVIMKLSSLPRFAVRCGRASVAKSDIKARVREKGDEAKEVTRVFSPKGGRIGLGKTASEACGDVINAFMTDDGRFFMLISDGMGSGADAALTSGVCAVFIEKLLRAGATMDTSLKMLNSMLRQRSGETSATVDLMELDLMNGMTRFVKSGAAPSFVLRGGRLFRLQSKTVPIGIVRALDAEMIRFECMKGDMIVMLSDGVVRSFEDCPWLYDMLCDRDEWTDDPEQMARRIIDLAVKNGAEDDITAGVVCVE